jgi:hypothetical protein
MFTRHDNGVRDGFIIGAMAAILIVIPSGLFAQSPLTIQASTGWWE